MKLPPVPSLYNQNRHFQKLEIHFDYCHDTPDFYLKAKFVNESKPSWWLSEVSKHIKEKFTNEAVAGGSRWAEIVEREHEKVHPDFRVREKMVLKISFTDDRRDTFRNTKKTTYQFPLV